MALIKWKGFAEATWEPVSELEETTALDRYEERHGPVMENNGPLEDYGGRRRRRGAAANAGRCTVMDDDNNEEGEDIENELDREFCPGTPPKAEMPVFIAEIEEFGEEGAENFREITGGGKEGGLCNGCNPSQPHVATCGTTVRETVTPTAPL